MRYKIKEHKNGIMILDYIGKDVQSLKIPNEINGNKVIAIGHGFLYCNESLKSIVLPGELQSIDLSDLL